MPMKSTALDTGIDIVRMLMAAAIFAAVVGQLALSIAYWSAHGQDLLALNLLNFFSFFTIESNVLAMVVLVWQVVARVRARRADAASAGSGSEVSRGLHVVVLCVTTYMVITGIVYNTVLRGIELPQGSTLGWSNEVLHLIAPLWMLIDWLLSARVRQVSFVHIWAVVIFPVVWLAYTLLRGPVTPNQATGASYWYPYPFLDPANFGGYGGVVISCVIVAVAIMGVAALLIAIPRWAARRPRVRQ